MENFMYLCNSMATDALVRNGIILAANQDDSLVLSLLVCMTISMIPTKSVGIV